VRVASGGPGLTTLAAARRRLLIVFVVPQSECDRAALRRPLRGPCGGRERTGYSDCAQRLESRFTSEPFRARGGAEGAYLPAGTRWVYLPASCASGPPFSLPWRWTSLRTAEPRSDFRPGRTRPRRVPAGATRPRPLHKQQDERGNQPHARKRASFGANVEHRFEAKTQGQGPCRCWAKGYRLKSSPWMP
jgi:hypothetical protein